MEDKFDVVFHHGGKFMKNGSLKYEGESTTFSFDPDVWSYFIIVDVVKGLGYEGFKELWYCVGGGSILENRLELLTNDTGAMHMINLARLNGQVHLFVVHLVSQLTKLWIPSWSAEKLFEVRHASQVGEKLVVDLDKHECSCRKWAVSGIPCCHALAAVKFLNLDAEDFIPGWFRKATYEETYSSIVYPLNGKNLWQVTPYNDVFPPKKRAMPGRPKKKRRLEEWELVRDETRMRKGGHRKRCGNCGEMGHNRKSCKQSTQASIVTDQTQQTDPPNEPIIPSAN